MILRRLQPSRSPLSLQTKWLGVVALILFSFVGAEAQNTKGDKAAGNQKSIFRLPKLKSKSKGGDKAYTGDVAGRRIRTKNKSSAVRALTKPLRYANRKPSGDRPYKVQGGPKLRIRSRTAEASRNNVYPNHGEFVNNPSKYPKDNQHAYSNRGTLSRAASLGTKREPPRRKRIVTPRSASRSFVTRGRKNVYWGKFRKGEKPFTTDISGRPLRAKNFHTPGLGVIPSGEVYKKRKTYGDQPYKGTYKSGYVTTPRSTKAWRGDVSGHAIRSRPPQVSQQAGQMVWPRKLSVSNKRRGPGKPLPGSGLAFHPGSARISNQPIPRKAPGLGASLIDKALGKFRGKKKPTGFLSRTKGGFDNKGKPIMVKGPGIGAKFVDRYQGFQKRGAKAFSKDGYGFAGTIKSQRAAKGGGSISGRSRDNGGQPINVKGPGIGGMYVDRYKGFMRGRKTLSVEGYDYAGNLKTKREPKGGGSISARPRNNRGQPIDVKGPGIGGKYADIYQGNIKFKRQPKGGGSISGGWNNNGQPINVKGPGIGGRFADIYQGNIKFKRQPKGGGSISGSWNNRGQPIDVKGPGIGGRFADIYQGNIKLRRQPKGGGSVSGKLWNNNGQPIIVRAPIGIQSKYVDTYKGFMKGGIKAFNTDGSDYKGNIKFFREPKGGGSVSGKLWNNSNRPIPVKPPDGIQAKYVDIYQGYYKAHKPIKGGGSVSGKLWNNHEEPIKGKAFPPASLKVTVFAGDRKQKKYVRNPNTKEEALKKMKPDKSNFLVADLQVKTKAKEYDRNKHSSKAALKGESTGKNSVRAIEYSNRIKQLWTKTFGDEKDLAGRIWMKKYVRNPNSKKGALMVMAPGKANARIKDLQVNVKMLKPHGNNLHPDSKFAHSLRDNVKHERTFLMTLKLKWAKLFKKNDTQPASVKEKVRRPRYDPKERDLWKDLYD